MNSQTPLTEPDPDTIKMFVGQIPRYMDENDLHKIFDEFGPVHQLNILRDKPSGHSKGCCFVTFYTRRAALEAQNALHNVKTLPGMQHPIQMKPADSEKRVEERKLFVGMLSKKCTETDVRHMFSPFGTIEECTVLREQNGQSRGCAFVTFSSRQCAQNAIRNLHHSRTMEGCRSPLVVKLADSHQEKEMKRLQQMQAQLLNGASMANLGALGQQYLTLLQQTNAGNLNSTIGNLGNSSLGLNALQMQQLLNAAQSVPGFHNQPPNASFSGDNIAGFQNLAALAALTNKFPGNNSSLAALQQLSSNSGGGMGTGAPNLPGLPMSPGSLSLNNASQHLNSLNNMTTLQNSLPQIPGNSNLGSAIPVTGGLNDLGRPPNTGGGMGTESPGAGLSSYQQPYGGLSGLLNPASFSNALSAQLQHNVAMASQYPNAGGSALNPNSPAGKQTEGPEGSNLFIYHLPQEFGDQELMQMFVAFGNVISSKVYIDKQTNLSKCFGFVSYDSPAAAQNAIQAMNGFQIGVKRLKVQLKRPKTEVRLY